MDRYKKLSYTFTLILVLVLYGVIGGLIGSGVISRYQTGILIIICINIILAVSLNITVGCLGQITIGHAGFMSVGAYAAALFQKLELLTGFLDM